MSRHPERKSEIEVNVLDVSEVEEAAKNQLEQKRDDVLEASVDHTWGYVETPDGIYILNDEGVGWEFDGPIDIPIRGTYDLGEGKRSFDFVPSSHFVIETEKTLKSFPVSRKENLATFIRVFGSRLESNFNEWNRVLTKATA